VLGAHAGTPPDPPSRHAPGPVPPELEAAILRALAKRPDDRFPTAAAFAEALAGAGRALEDRAARARWPRLLPLFFGVLAAAFAVSAAVTALVLEVLR
jgi:hypothetical protein